MELKGVENHISQAENESKEAQQTHDDIGSKLFDEAHTALRHLVNPTLKDMFRSSDDVSAAEPLDEVLTTNTQKN